MSEGLYFRQFLAGRDFAVGDDVALSMRNFSYALGDRITGEAVLVDPAYDPLELVSLVASDGLRVVGAIATHFHADHVGGRLMDGVNIVGVAALQATGPTPVHVHRDEVDLMKANAGVGDDVLVIHEDGDVIKLGDLTITLLHTPGHTPGSQCLAVSGLLLSGDTLFIDGCGRTDFAGGDPYEMYKSLSERLAVVGDDVELFPGHLYSPESSLSMGEVRARNYVLEARSAEQWLAMFGS